MLRAKLGGYIFEPLEAIQVILDCLGQFWAISGHYGGHFGSLWPKNLVFQCSPYLKILLGIACFNFFETPRMLNKLRH